MALPPADPSAAPAPRTPLVIGLGNDDRGDDAAGLAVVRALGGRTLGPARILEGPREATGLLDLWTGAERVIVVDAVRSGRPPGTVVRLEVGPHGFPSSVRSSSTHGLSLAEAVGLGISLGAMPRSLVVYGVEAGDFAAGRGLSGPVARGVIEAARRVADELAGAAFGADEG